MESCSCGFVDGDGLRVRRDRHTVIAGIAGDEVGFVLLTAYTGPIGAFFYVLGCLEPLTGQHEGYTAARWRQVLGSAMHCVAGDGVGILAGAVIGSLLALTGFRAIVVEYVLGFGFGWTIFQALFMRTMQGGSYPRALASSPSSFR